MSWGPSVTRPLSCSLNKCDTVPGWGACPGAEESLLAPQMGWITGGNEAAGKGWGGVRGSALTPVHTGVVGRRHQAATRPPWRPCRRNPRPKHRVLREKGKKATATPLSSPLMPAGDTQGSICAPQRTGLRGPALPGPTRTQETPLARGILAEWVSPSEGRSQETPPGLLSR